MRALKKPKNQRYQKNILLSPVTRELAGMVRVLGIKDKDILVDSLIEKHRERRAG